jgi:hypothetical protein
VPRQLVTTGRRFFATNANDPNRIITLRLIEVARTASSSHNFNQDHAISGRRCCAIASFFPQNGISARRSFTGANLHDLASRNGHQAARHARKNHDQGSERRAQVTINLSERYASGQSKADVTMTISLLQGNQRSQYGQAGRSITVGLGFPRISNRRRQQHIIRQGCRGHAPGRSDNSHVFGIRPEKHILLEDVSRAIPRTWSEKFCFQIRP